MSQTVQTNFPQIVIPQELLEALGQIVGGNGPPLPIQADICIGRG